ncbi:MAG: glycogen/starch synthase [Deltaproteobacteria bacterium]|nr:glycogen/starch synthase [Deltaproteobacteria bacterium]
MKIFHVASLMNPYIRGSGVADVMHALTTAQAKYGADVSVLLPLYSESTYQHADLQKIGDIEVNTGERKEAVGIFQSFLPVPGTDRTVRIFFAQHPFFTDFFKNYEDIEFGRYILQGKSLFEICKLADIRPDIIHGHGRAGTLAAVFFRRHAEHRELMKHSRFLFTLHGTTNQGRFPLNVLSNFPSLDDLRDSLINDGKVDLIRAAVLAADATNVVSRNYAYEVQTDRFGLGMQGIFRQDFVEGRFFGIPNGLGLEWDPSSDPHIHSSFSASAPDGKDLNRRTLRSEWSLSVDEDDPIVAVHSRLSWSKGIDVIDAAFSTLMENHPIGLITLGSPTTKGYDTMVEGWQHRYPGRVAVKTSYDPVLAHRLLAGADIFLHPSRGEPDGLAPKMAVRYGLIPVVTPYGGMPDTARGVGFVTWDNSPDEIAAGVRQAVNAWRNPQERERRMTLGMNRNFSWDTSVQLYFERYHQMLSRPPAALR